MEGFKIVEIKRKIYERIKNWKDTVDGQKALLIEGARRIGKSTIAEEFGKNEYETYILIDFNKASKKVKDAFEDLNNLDLFFQTLTLEYNTRLHPRKSLIIFDEIQKFPKAREAIKYLVADGRYDYIETGSLISIKENVEEITIPSEERKMKMHVKAMHLFKEYLLVGGMPQALVAFKKNGRDFVKCYMGDTGLLVSHAFNENELMNQQLYKQIIIHPKNFSIDNDVMKIPPYMLWCVF